jgi:hypothetical protein
VQVEKRELPGDGMPMSLTNAAMRQVENLCPKPGLGSLRPKTHASRRLRVAGPAEPPRTFGEDVIRFGWSDPRRGEGHLLHRAVFAADEF